jgi:hypothetical protein
MGGPELRPCSTVVTQRRRGWTRAPTLLDFCDWIDGVWLSTNATGVDCSVRLSSFRYVKRYCTACPMQFLSQNRSSPAKLGKMPIRYNSLSFVFSLVPGTAVKGEITDTGRTR